MTEPALQSPPPNTKKKFFHRPRQPANILLPNHRQLPIAAAIDRANKSILFVFNDEYDETETPV